MLRACTIGWAHTLLDKHMHQTMSQMCVYTRSTYMCCPLYITGLHPASGSSARLMHVACMKHMHITTGNALRCCLRGGATVDVLMWMDRRGRGRGRLCADAAAVNNCAGSYNTVKGRSHTGEKRVSMHPHKPHAARQPSLSCWYIMMRVATAGSL